MHTRLSRRNGLTIIIINNNKDQDRKDAYGWATPTSSPKATLTIIFLFSSGLFVIRHCFAGVPRSLYLFRSVFRAWMGSLLHG